MKYRKRILLSFASVLFLPLILNDVLIFSSIRNRELAMKREYIAGQVSQIRGTVDYVINRILSDFVFLSYKDELRYLHDWYEKSDYRARKRFLDELNPFSMLSEYYDEAFLVHPEDDIMIDLKNKLISPVSKSSHGGKITAAIDIHDQFGGKKELFVNREEDSHAVGFLVKSIPIGERGTRMLLYIELSDKLFKGVLDDIFLIDSSYAVITNDFGDIITSRSRDIPLKKDPASFISETIRTERSGIVENGTGKYLVASDSSTDLAWNYFYGISFSSVEGSIWAVLFRYTLIAAGVLLVFSFVVQYISRGMYKPFLDIAGLFHEDGAVSDDIELKDFQANIRHLVERNRELTVSAGDSMRLEREAALKALIYESGGSVEQLSSTISSLGLDIPVHDEACYFVCAGIARPEEMQRMSADAFYGHNTSVLRKRFGLPDDAHVECLVSDERHFVFVVGLCCDGEAAPNIVEVSVEDREHSAVCVGVSAMHDRLEGIREGYREAMIALEYRSLFKGRSVVRYEEALAKKKSGYFYPQEIERKLVSFIKQLDRDGVNEQLDILNDTVVMSGISFANTKRLYLHLLDSLILIAKNFSISVDSSGFGGPENLWDRIEQAEAMKEIEAVVRSFALQLVELLQSAKESPMVSLANAVKSFVDRNYQDRNLSLDLIADELKYSVSHVSTVFKETFGETVKDYITGLRLTRACDMLVKTDLQISRIGNEVGYDNLGSFVKIFKAYLGETPKNYRMRIRGK